MKVIGPLRQMPNCCTRKLAVHRIIERDLQAQQRRMQEVEGYWLKRLVVRSAVASVMAATEHLRLYATLGSRVTQCQPNPAT